MQAKSNLLAEERQKVSTAMCHNLKTADRFYSKNPSLWEALKVREMVRDMLNPSPGASTETLSVNNPPTSQGQEVGISVQNTSTPVRRKRPRRRVRPKMDRGSDTDSDPDKDMKIVY